MKIIAMTLLLIVSTSAQANAKAKGKTTATHTVRVSEELVAKLHTACAEAAIRNKTPVKDVELGCKCLVSKISVLASTEKTEANAEADMNWAIDVYSQKLTQREFEKDPRMMAEDLADFGAECIKAAN